MKIFVILCAITLTLLASCKKQPLLPYTFVGIVTDINGNPIGGATVTLSAYYWPNSISSGGYYQAAQTKTSSDGKFNASFTADGSTQGLWVQVSANNYFPYSNEKVFYTDIQNNALNVNPALYKIATIKISFKNAFPVSSLDSFFVFQTNEQSGSFNTFVERQYSGGTYDVPGRRYVGNNIQGYEVTKTKGDSYTVINWGSQKNGIRKYVVDSVFIAGGAQGNYNINY